MVDEKYSEAVIAFVGVAGRLDSRSPEERVAAIFGDAAFDLVPRIREMLGRLYSVDPPLWAHSDIAEVGRQAGQWLRAHYPTLSDDAVKAVTNRFSFDWR